MTLSLAAAMDEHTAIFVTVPEVTLLDGTIVPSFRVGQFACSRDDSGRPVVRADLPPWVRINYANARQVLEEAGWQMITERQWLAIATDAARQDCNWTGARVGEGELFQGIRNCNVGNAQPGNYESSDATERRWLTLSNGARVADFNGNLFQWVSDDVQGDESGLIAKAFAADSVSLQAPYPSLKKGMGWRPDGARDWSGLALFRGGCWGSGAYAGVFLLNRGWPDYANDYVGFRCTLPNGL